MHTKQVVRFTEDEAKEKLGRNVHSLVEFSGVPMGTAGRVVGLHRTREDAFDVVVEWSLPVREKPLQDRFAKQPYEHMLSENSFAYRAH
jgi:hypothetical protein